MAADHLCDRSAVSSVETRGHGEAKDLSGITTQHPDTGLFAQILEIALDGFGRMGPCPLVVRVVICPQDIVDEIVLLDEIEAGLVLAEGCKAVRAEIVAGKRLELGSDPEMMLEIRFVHRIEHPCEPTDPGFDRSEAQLWKSLRDTR